ncbi:hypothetical protein VNO78_06966 [Psophocarpus tetragonolobus]|uniref:Protein LNK3 n=1 Tax=Psophocarpus tetragonolobus TaxID=3891 RepID=A0AAN9SSZ7_PSOTE
MDWYYGCKNNDFLVPKDQEDLLERHHSPDSWSEWGINAPETFNSPQECLFMNTNEVVEFNFIDESFNNEIEFDPCLYNKDQSSSSSVCEGLSEQSFQQTKAPSCDHQPNYQLQDLSTFGHMDDFFLDSVLEDFPCVESLHKSFFDPENQCSNSTGGVQKDISDSGFVSCNSDSKDCMDIEANEVKDWDPFEQSNGNEMMLEQLSHEEFTLQGFEMIISQLTEKTRICFRDALYRLARNTKHVLEDLDGGLNMHQEIPRSIYNEAMRSEENKPMESETNSIDRAVANLMFNKMEINIVDLPLTTLVNLKQDVIGSKCLQGKSSKAMNVTQKSDSPKLQKLPADAEVPRFGLEDQQESTESYITYKTSPFLTSSSIQWLAVSIQLNFDWNQVAKLGSLQDSVHLDIFLGVQMIELINLNLAKVGSLQDSCAVHPDTLLGMQV